MNSIFYVKEIFNDGSFKIVWAIVGFESKQFIFKNVLKITKKTFIDRFIMLRYCNSDKYRIDVINDDGYVNRLKEIRSKRKKREDWELIKSVENDSGEQGYTIITKNNQVVGIS